MHLLIHEIGHVAIYLLLFFVANLLLKKKIEYKYCILGLFISVFLDIDHLFDYFMYYGLKFNLLEFLSADYFQASRKVYVLLHGWEYLLILSIFYKIFTKKRTLILIICLGLGAHLLFDTLSHNPNLFGYFFFYRASHNFDLNSYISIVN